jgi:hypothetical protein
MPNAPNLWQGCVRADLGSGSAADHAALRSRVRLLVVSALTFLAADIVAGHWKLAMRFGAIAPGCPTS